MLTTLLGPPALRGHPCHLSGKQVLISTKNGKSAVGTVIDLGRVTWLLL
jgi:hypothetical protein